MILPSASLMALLWWLHGAYLRHRYGPGKTLTTMLLLGWGACLGLVLYVTVLGEIGDLWRKGTVRLEFRDAPP